MSEEGPAELIGRAAGCVPRLFGPARVAEPAPTHRAPGSIGTGEALTTSCDGTRGAADPRDRSVWRRRWADGGRWCRPAAATLPPTNRGWCGRGQRRRSVSGPTGTELRELFAPLVEVDHPKPRDLARAAVIELAMTGEHFEVRLARGRSGSSVRRSWIPTTPESRMHAGAFRRSRGTRMRRSSSSSTSPPRSPTTIPPRSRWRACSSNSSGSTRRKRSCGRSSRSTSSSTGTGACKRCTP